MVLQKQIKLSDYYVKKNGNTISQDGNNVTAANKNVATDGSGNVIFEEKNNHNHGNIGSNGTMSGKGQNVVTDSNGNITTETKPDIPTKTSDLTNDSDYLTNSDAQSTYVPISKITGTITDTNRLYAPGTIPDIPNDQAVRNLINNRIVNSISDEPSVYLNPTAPSVDAVRTYVNNKVDASFKVEVIQNYTVEDLEDNYHSIDGDSFGQLIYDENMNYDANTIYLLPNQSDFPSFYNEYILISDSDLGYPLFELLGTTQIDLSNYISKQITSSDILLANGTTIAQSSFIPKGSTGDIQLANGSTTPTSSFATSGHSHDSTYIPLSARKATVTSGDTTGVPTGDAVQKAIDATLDNIITQLRS